MISGADDDSSDISSILNVTAKGKDVEVSFDVFNVFRSLTSLIHQALSPEYAYRLKYYDCKAYSASAI